MSDTWSKRIFEACKFFCVQGLPGIYSFKRIIMQLFHCYVPDVNLSHLKVPQKFWTNIKSTEKYTSKSKGRCRNKGKLGESEILIITRAQAEQGTRALQEVDPSWLSAFNYNLLNSTWQVCNMYIHQTSSMIITLHNQFEKSALLYMNT